MDATELLERFGTRMRVRAGDVVFREGDASAAVYGVAVGRVRVEVTTPTGGRLVLGVKEPGDLLGEMGALDGSARSASAVAMEDVELVQASVDEFVRALAEDPRLALDLLRRLSVDLRRSVGRTTARASADTTQRLAMLLVDLAERYGDVNGDQVEIDLQLTQDDVAGWIGATREATARSLRTLRDGGCVSTGRRRISVTDIASLRHAAMG
ncbi:MAG: Crp/Fnr family transcriptional regulator [Actinomycetota bacterium]